MMRRLGKDLFGGQILRKDQSLKWKRKTFGLTRLGKAVFDRKTRQVRCRSVHVHKKMTVV